MIRTAGMMGVPQMGLCTRNVQANYLAHQM